MRRRLSTPPSAAENMLRCCRLFVFAVAISQCLLRPYVVAFRVWRSTVNTNPGHCQIIRLSSSDDDIRALYKKAQIEDAEWLQRVLGTAPVTSDVKDLNDGNRLNSAKLNGEKGWVANSPPQLPTESLDVVTSEALFLLGYSVTDISSMKETVISVILESSVKRPRRGLPQSWMKTATVQENSVTGNGTKSSMRTDGRRPSLGSVSDERQESNRQSFDNGNGAVQDKESDERQRARSNEEGDSSQYERKNGKKDSNVGEAFAWKGSPPTRDELENSQRLRRDFREKESQNTYSNNEPQMKSKNFAKSDWDDVRH